MFAPAVIVYDSFVWARTMGDAYYLLFPQESGTYTANSLHDGHVAVQAEACLCMDRRMGIICILMFLCSYVLITCLQPALCSYV